MQAPTTAELVRALRLEMELATNPTRQDEWKTTDREELDGLFGDHRPPVEEDVGWHAFMEPEDWGECYENPHPVDVAKRVYAAEQWAEEQEWLEARGGIRTIVVDAKT